MHTRIPEPLKALVDQLARLPGLGPKSAMRVAMTLLKWPEAETRRLGRSIPELSRSLCHIIASGMFNRLFEIVVHDMPREQALRDVEQFRSFYTGGWLKLMGG